MLSFYSIFVLPLVASVAVASAIPSYDALPSNSSAGEDVKALSYWDAGDLKASPTTYKKAAKDYGYVFTVDNNSIKEVPFVTSDGFDADHVFESQLGANALNAMQVPFDKTASWFTTYKNTLNGIGNMRYVTASVNRKKGNCVVQILKKESMWDCTDLVNQYVKLVAGPMRTTANSLDALFPNNPGYHLMEAELILTKLGALQPSHDSGLPLEEVDEVAEEDRAGESYIQAVLSHVTKWWMDL